MIFILDSLYFSDYFSKLVCIHELYYFFLEVYFLYCFYIHDSYFAEGDSS